MAVATATVTLDDDGVVKGVRTINSEFRELAEGAERAGEGVEEFEETAASAVGRMDQFNQSIEEGFGLTRQFANAQEQLAEGGRDMVASVDRQVDAMEQMERQTKTLSTNQSKYNQIVFSSGDLVQDLQFGIKGAANNIAFMAEQMAETTARGGGFSQMLRGIWGALKGPAGIILGIQALLVLGPKLASWFQNQTENAEEFKEGLEDAASSLLDFKDNIEGFQVENLEQARQVVTELENQKQQQQEKVNLLKEVRDANDLNIQQIEGLTSLTREEFIQAKQRFNLAGAQTEEITKRLQKEQESLDAIEKSVEQAESLVASRKAARLVEDAIAKTTADRGDEEEDATDAALGFTEQMKEAHRIQTQLIKDLEEIDFSAELQIPKAAFVEDVADAEEALEKGLVESIAGVNNVLSLLQREFEQATTDEQRERIRELINAFQALRDEMQRGKEESKDFVDVLKSLDKQRIIAGAIATKFEELGQAIGQGERVMESFGDAALGVLASIGQAMGKQLIAQGSALLASALIPGQQGNAAAGAALIAAGTSLVAASTKLSSTLKDEQEGDQTTPGERDRLQGGGRARTDVTPGRQFGGPVQAGRLYETHGLGTREFFRPMVSGQVMTRNQMRTATERRGVQVNGTLSGKISVEDVTVETKLERLRLRLNDLDQEISELT